MQTISKTSTRLIEMLTENTGRSLLDSGDAYGRNWERNQGHTLEEWLNRPTACLDTDYGLDVSVDTFHFLNDRLRLTEKAEQLQKVFEDYIAEDEDRSPWACEDMEGFAELVSDGSEEVSPRIVNTYNFENLLTQTLQYVEFNHEGDSFILLQIHGGCDVRGGYTHPQVFETLNGYYFTYETQNADVSCTSCEWWLSISGGDVYDANDVYYTYKEREEIKACPQCGGELKANAPWVN